MELFDQKSLVSMGVPLLATIGTAVWLNRKVSNLEAELANMKAELVQYKEILAYHDAVLRGANRPPLRDTPSRGEPPRTSAPPRATPRKDTPREEYDYSAVRETSTPPEPLEISEDEIDNAIEKEIQRAEEEHERERVESERRETEREPLAPEDANPAKKKEE